jgi:hypothetical protein
VEGRPWAFPLISSRIGKVGSSKLSQRMLPLHGRREHLHLEWAKSPSHRQIPSSRIRFRVFEVARTLALLYSDLQVRGDPIEFLLGLLL